VIEASYPGLADLPFGRVWDYNSLTQEMRVGFRFLDDIRA